MKNINVPFLPEPKRIESNGHVCRVTGGTACYTNAGAGISFSYLLGLAGIHIAQAQALPCGSAAPYTLVLGEMPKTLSLCPEGRGEEAYALESTENTIVIAANSVCGLAHGVKLLVRLGRAELLKSGYCVWDEPDIAFRAVHMCVFNPDDGTEKDDTSLPELRRRILAAALSGYNYVFLEFWGMFPYRRQPDAKWPKALTWEQVTGLVNEMRNDLFITPCPAQNLTSHAGWSRIISRKHVMLDQHPERADLYVPGGWCFTTEREETRAFLRDIMDDLIEAFQNPPYLHCCCDKCYAFGSTEEDRTKPADMLFVNHLCFLNNHLSEKGVRMVMWSDMLYSSMDVLNWKCAPETSELLPKNILINIWTHNDPGGYWHDIDFFESKGFQTVYAPFFNRAGARSMVGLCKRHGSLGIMQTTWHRPELALPTIIFSGGAQWGDSRAADCDERLESCLKLYRE